MGLADKFEFAPDLVPKVKLGLHITHGIFAFVIFVLEIIVFRKQDAIINGNNGWTFAMVCTATALAKRKGGCLLTFCLQTVFHNDSGCALSSDDTTVGANTESRPAACDDCRGLHLDDPMVVSLRYSGILQQSGLLRTGLWRKQGYRGTCLFPDVSFSSMYIVTPLHDLVLNIHAGYFGSYLP